MIKKKDKKIEIKTKKIINNLFLGTYKSVFRWKGLEFDRFKEYEYWDDIKDIDYLTSAKIWKTVIRRYEQERELNIVFLLDLSISMNFSYYKSKIDTLKEIYYLLALSSYINWDVVSAVLFWGKEIDYIKPNKWKENIINIIDKIGDYKNNGENKKSLDLNFLNKINLKNSIIFLLTDKLDYDKKEINILWKKNDLIYINIFDSFENKLSNENKLLLLWNNKKDIVIDLDNKEAISKYINLRDNRLRKIKRELRSYNIDYFYIDETLDIYKEILRFMKSRIK